MIGLAMAAWIVFMSPSSKAMWASRFLILAAGYTPSFFTAAAASPFAAQAATLPFLDWTLTLTRGLTAVGPLPFDTPVATDCVEIPFRNAPGLVRQTFATVLITDCALMACPTADGLVC